MGPDQGLPAPELGPARAAERGQERGRLRRFSQRPPIADLGLAPTASQRRVDARQLRLEPGHGPPPTVDQLGFLPSRAAHPRGEPVFVGEALLQELVSPTRI